MCSADVRLIIREDVLAQLADPLLFTVANLVDLAPVHDFNQWVRLADHLLETGVNIDWVICKVYFNKAGKVSQVIDRFDLVHSVVLQVKNLEDRHFEVEVGSVYQAVIAERKLPHVEEIWEGAQVGAVLEDEARVHDQFLEILAVIEKLEVALVVGQLDLGYAESAEVRAVAEGGGRDLLDGVLIKSKGLDLWVADQSTDSGDFVAAQVQVGEVYQEEAHVLHARLFDHVAFQTELLELFETAKACDNLNLVSI